MVPYPLSKNQTKSSPALSLQLPKLLHLRFFSPAVVVQVRLQLWDIAGQDRFAKLTRAYFRRAKGAVVVCDVTRAGTFDAIVKWKVRTKNGQICRPTCVDAVETQLHG